MCFAPRTFGFYAEGDSPHDQAVYSTFYALTSESFDLFLVVSDMIKSCDPISSKCCVVDELAAALQGT
jgi:hypothetical protein